MTVQGDGFDRCTPLLQPERDLVLVLLRRNRRGLPPELAVRGLRVHQPLEHTDLNMEVVGDSVEVHRHYVVGRSLDSRKIGADQIQLDDRLGGGAGVTDRLREPPDEALDLCRSWPVRARDEPTRAPWTRLLRGPDQPRADASALFLRKNGDVYPSRVGCVIRRLGACERNQIFALEGADEVAFPTVVGPPSGDSRCLSKRRPTRSGVPGRLTLDCVGIRQRRTVSEIQGSNVHRENLPTSACRYPLSSAVPRPPRHARGHLCTASEPRAGITG